MTGSRVPMGEAIRFGWDTMKNNAGFFIGLLIVAFLIENLPGMLSEFVVHDFPVIAVLLSLTGAVLGLMVQMGLIKVSLKFCDGIKGQLDDLLSYFNLLFKFGAASLLYGLITLGGTLLFIIPGIIWGVKFSLFPYFIVDKEVGPVEAIKASGEATNGAKWDLFLMWMLLGLINVAGALALMVGLFATIPTTMIAYAYVYRALAGHGERVPGVSDKGPDTPAPTMYIKMEA